MKDPNRLKNPIPESPPRTSKKGGPKPAPGGSGPELIQKPGEITTPGFKPKPPKPETY